jgi:hypothetical protein
MPINWGKVFDGALDIAIKGAAIGITVAVIQGQIKEMCAMSEQDAVRTMAKKVSVMDDEVWEAWVVQLMIMRQDYSMANLLLEVGNYTRSEMAKIQQLIGEYSINDGVEIVYDKLFTLNELQAICYACALETISENNLKAEAIVNRLSRKLLPPQ